MSRPWDADVEITVEAAAALVRSQFPSIPAHSARRLGHGWDNTAILIDERIVFRFPRRASTAALLATESRVLPRLRGRLPLPIPQPEWPGRPGPAFPWPFLGHALLPGRPASAARLSRTAREETAPALAGFLRQLHALPLSALELPADTLDRRNFAKRMPLMEERLETLCAHAVIADPGPWLRLFIELQPAVTSGPDRPVHGDLYARHLLVDDRDRLAGVIDWGDVHAGDPAMDLMLLFGFLPATARPAFLDAYGPVAEDVLRTARLRAAFHAVSVTWHGLEDQADDLLEEGRQALDFVLE